MHSRSGTNLHNTGGQGGLGVGRLSIIKGASAVGLVVGLKRPRLGELTAAAFIAYFVAALGFHARAKDGVLRFAPAAGVLMWAVLALRFYRASPT